MIRETIGAIALFVICFSILFIQGNRDMKYIVRWVQWGTNMRCEDGPFDTIEEAQRWPLSQAYGPVYATVKVYEIKESEQ